MNKRQLLVVYNYGMGGLWGILLAESADEILRAYPELAVVDDYGTRVSGEQSNYRHYSRIQWLQRSARLIPTLVFNLTSGREARRDRVR
ncbi:MAG: hypothetical protein JWN70_3306 [Planctomycetaceae bacterium]|nr:hypothetical protein [Planctomycetaceae bacterium]